MIVKPMVCRPSVGRKRYLRSVVSVEKDVIIGIMIGEDIGWRGTLEGLKKTLKGEIDVK
jgi:hypothetical protein